MSKPISISIDLMGATESVSTLLKGVDQARKSLPGVNFLLHGDEQEIRMGLRKYSRLKRVSVVVHAGDFFQREDNERACVTKLSRDTSLGNAVKSVAAGQADVAVSAGNTAAQVLACHKFFKLLPGCKPAIAAEFPTKGTTGQRTLFLDNGASPDVAPEELVVQAQMGAVAACVLFGLETAYTRLLSNGNESHKGNKLVKAAKKLLEEQADKPLLFGGTIRGYEVMDGVANVVVADGHTGNVFLTGMEGTAAFVKAMMKAVARDKSRLGPLWAALAYPFLKLLKKRMDRQRYNGGPFLGYDGLLVKSHGSTNATGFANAIVRAHSCVEADLVGQLQERFGE